MEPITVKYKVLDTRAKVPSYATPGSAAADLCAVLDAPLTLAPMERALVPTGLAVGQHAGLVAVGAVVDVLQRAGAGEHQRHMTVDHHAGGHRLTVPGGCNGRNIAVLHLRQNKQAGKPLLCIELRRPCAPGVAG